MRTVFSRRAGFDRVVAEDTVASRLVERRAEHAVQGRGGGRNRRDDVLDLDFVVVEHEAEVREEARLDHRREGEGFRGFRLQVRVTTRHAGDAGRIGRVVVVVRVNGVAVEVEVRVGDAAAGSDLCEQGRAVGDTVGPVRRVGDRDDLAGVAGIDHAVVEGLAPRSEVFTQVRGAERGVEARLERDVPDRAIDEVHAVNVASAHRGVVEVAVRTAELGVFAQPAVAEQRDRKFGEGLFRFIFSAREVRARVQEQEAVAGRGRTAHAFRVFAALFGTEGDADRAGTEEVPQLAADEEDRLLLLVALGHDDRGIDVAQGGSALVATAEDVQRGALVEGAEAFSRVTQIATAEAVTQEVGGVLGAEQVGPADDLAGTAVDHTGHVDHRVRAQLEALVVGAAFDVFNFDDAGVVRQGPVEVLDEPQAVEIAFKRHVHLDQFAGVELGTVRAEQDVLREGRSDRRAVRQAADGVGRSGERLAGVGLDRRAQVRRQIGRRVQVDQELVGRQGRVDIARPEGVREEEGVEGRLADIEGFFGDVFGVGREAQVVEDVEVDTRGIAVGFGFRRPRELAEVSAVVAVTADVDRAELAAADTLAEVGQARGRAVEHPGEARSDVIAGRGRDAGAVGERGFRIVQRAGRTVVGNRGLAPAQDLQLATLEERAGDVEDAVADGTDDGVGRVGVNRGQAGVGPVPVDVQDADFVVAIVFGEGPQVQAVIEQVGADQGRNALVGLAFLVDHAVVGVDFETFIVLAEHEVQHAGDGVSAVNRGGAAGDDFDVLDQQARDGVDVDSQRTTVGADLTAAVDEGQGAARTQRAQVGQRQTAVTQVRTGRVRRDHRVRQGRDGGQIVDHGRLTGRQQVFARNRDQRGRSVGRVTTDARTRDDDFVELGGFLVGLTLDVHARELALGEGRSRDGHDAREDRRAKKVLALEKHGDWAPTVVDALHSVRRTTDSVSDHHASSNEGKDKALWRLGDQSVPLLLQ